MNNQPNKTTLTAANDNPGGEKSVEITLSNLVSVIAKAYVARTRKESSR
ncbi:hypothetical protein LZG00_13505 [Rhodobacteraceae bacterium LMO-12]|nr:hypothetical protein [Rhodobacteraceae bacterium LMO-JJ12]